MIKGSIQVEDISILDIHTTNIGAPKNININKIKGEIDGKVKIWDPNTPITSVDGSFR